MTKNPQFSTWNPEFTAWNQESNTLLYFIEFATVTQYGDGVKQDLRPD